MAWTLEYAPAARKALRKIDRQVGDRILAKLENIVALEDPRNSGKPLVGKLAGLWRYRIGDWRVVVMIEEQRLVVLVLEVDHRSKVYRG